MFYNSRNPFYVPMCRIFRIKRNREKSILPLSLIISNFGFANIIDRLIATISFSQFNFAVPHKVIIFANRFMNAKLLNFII